MSLVAVPVVLLRRGRNLRQPRDTLATAARHTRAVPTVTPASPTVAATVRIFSCTSYATGLCLLLLSWVGCIM